MVYGAPMRRTQILLEPWQYGTLKALADGRGVSLSSLVGEAVEVYLRSGEAGPAPSLADIDGVGSDAGSSGRDHDDILYGEDQQRPV
jgi:hypothetical protein